MDLQIERKIARQSSKSTVVLFDLISITRARHVYTIILIIISSDRGLVNINMKGSTEFNSYHLIVRCKQRIGPRNTAG